MNAQIPPYNYEWIHPNSSSEFQSGCKENFWWLQVWKTQENYKRFLIPEQERNTGKWDFTPTEDIKKYFILDEL